jgi:predicted nucleic acid-binding protein
MKNGTGRAYVLDSYAVLAWLQAAASGAIVADLLAQAKHGGIALSMCVVNLGEVLYIVEREESIQVAQRVLATIDALPVRQVVAARDLTLQAAHFKALYRMSYADCFGLALAKRANGILVTGDPEFRTQNEVELLWMGDPQR